MVDTPKKNLIKISIFLVVGGITFLFSWLNFTKDQKSTIVFCDVGQGDASYVRLKNQFDILVDTGPDRSVLNCLGKFMPFFDRKIELVILSHPQKDHFGGLDYILDRYQVKKIILPPIDNNIQSFIRLKEKINKKKINLKTFSNEKKLKIMNAKLEFLWPTKNFLSNNLVKNKNSIFGQSNLDPNFFSLVFLITIYSSKKNYKILYTGDSPKSILDIISLIHGSKIKTDILKIPHHGSKKSLSENFFYLANPKLVVISVGKKNKFGHPHQEIISFFRAKKVLIKRTDYDGNINIFIKE